MLTKLTIRYHQLAKANLITQHPVPFKVARNVCVE